MIIDRYAIIRFLVKLVIYEFKMLLGHFRRFTYWLESGMTLRLSLTVYIQIERVKSLHEIGIIHCDIKPDNIMFKEEMCEQNK